MNELVNRIKQHRSIRNYTGEAVKEEDLQAIIESAILAPSSINGQQWSILIVKDKEKKKKLVELCGGQPWIEACDVFMIFLMDYYPIAKKMEEKGLPFEHATSIESIMVGSVDVGIAYSNAMNVAESLGYGTVPIGAIRREPYEVIDMFELPKYVYPILGMCIGVEEGQQAVKPKMSYDTKVSIDVYNSQRDQHIEKYDAIIKKYMEERTNHAQSHTWSEAVATVYSKVYFPKVKGSLHQQGFTYEK